MALSCSCDGDFDASDVAWYWMGHSHWKPMLPTGNRKRCCSCKSLINVGEDVYEFRRMRAPRNDLEERIYGDDLESGVPLASWWACEVCSGLMMAAEDLGFCYNLGDNIIYEIAAYRDAEKQYKQFIADGGDELHACVEDYLE